MDKLVLLPPIITVFLLVTKGFTRTFCYFWIPLLLAVPVYLEMDGPGIPPLGFYLTGFLPFLFRQELRIAALQDVHWIDFFVYAFVFSIAGAESMTESINSGRQMLFLNGLALIGPYLAVKYIILHEKEDINLAAMFVAVLAIIGVYNLYTWRMGLNHFARIREIWPSYYGMTNLAVLQRWGFFRACGPFVHPITAGIIYGFGLPMTFWLARYKKVKPVWKAYFYAAFCFVGLFVTMSRGPIIGAFLAIGLFVVGQSKMRTQLFILCGLLGVFASVPLGMKAAAYLSLDRASAVTDEQETALYRKELITNYMEIVAEEPFTGYGLLRIPYVGGQTSIDNAYMYLALSWGVIPVLALLGLAIGCLISLVRMGFKEQTPTLDRAIVWSLMGGISGCMVSLATVFLAKPASTILFMWAGWSAALLMRQKRNDSVEQVSSEAKAPSIKKREMTIL